MAKVKIKIPTIEKRIKTLNAMTNKILVPVAEFTKGFVLKSWGYAKGPDDKAFNGLTDKYKNKKVKSGRNPIRDLNFKGQLTQALGINKKKNSVIIGWNDGTNLNKARGNQRYAKNMMDVGTRLNNKAQDMAFKLFTR